MAKNKTLFISSKSKYSEIVEIDDIDSAKESIKKLQAEYDSSKRRDKKIRIYHVADLTSKRCYASARRKNISPKEKSEFKKIGNLYQDFALRLKMKNQKLQKPIKKKKS